MLIITPGPTVRIRPIDHAIADYDIALNLAANTGTVLHELCFYTRRTEIRSRHTRTAAAVAASAAGHLPTSSTSSAEMTRPMVPHYGKPLCIPFYRDNHAPRRAMFGTLRHNTLRGPPDSCRRPRGAQRDAQRAAQRGPEVTACLRMPCQRTAQATTHSEADGKEQRKGTGGIDRKSHPQSREQGPR